MFGYSLFFSEGMHSSQLIIHKTSLADWFNHRLWSGIIFFFFKNHLCPIDILFNSLSFNDENIFVLTASIGMTASCIWVGAAKQAPKTGQMPPKLHQIEHAWKKLEVVEYFFLGIRISVVVFYLCFIFFNYVFFLFFFFFCLFTFLLFHSCGGLLFASPLVFHLAKPYSSLTCLLSIHSYI